MKIEVVATAGQATENLTKGKTVVVIDVLRATSVITTALYHGAEAVWPVASIEEAHRLYDSFTRGTALRGGERQGLIIPGFELGNSPLSYTSETIAAKNIILTTSNGTHAIRNSAAAQALFVVSFLNLPFAARQLQNATELIIVCSGTNGRFSADDGLCAGMLILELEKFTDTICCDLGLVLRQFAAQAGSPAEKLVSCFHLNYLQSIGYQADIDFCLQQGLMPVLPVLTEVGSLRV